MHFPTPLPGAPLTALLTALALAPATPARADDGKTLYHDNCRKCHGADGRARTVRGFLYFARDFTDPAWQARHSDEEVYKIISDSPGWYSTMPAFRKRLSEEDRRALVDVVRSFGKTEVK